ncbi:MAG: GIY-YIG nuclease family protein [candidate division SR1 bacterium]|nr:GIY-YIG nuclease family protein [candidate division SR1 bacterium]
MFGYVYVLEMANGKYYVGSTKNIQNRLIEHQTGESKSTKNHLPVKLLFYKKYATIIEAIHMETKIKKSKSRKVIELFIKD